MKHPRHICLLIACFSLGSCTLAVPQFEQLSSIFAEKDVDDDGLRLEFLWTADVNSQGKLMTLYTLESGGFVFASEEGDLISFDGWVVTSLKGFGLPGLLTIKDENGARVIENNGNFDSEVDCGEWRSVSNEMVKSWKQSCKGLTTDNEIVLNDDGDVIQVRQVISFDGSEVVLKKL
jgi:hypothetical protein